MYNLPLPILLCCAQALCSETSYCYRYYWSTDLPVCVCVCHTVLCSALYTACVDASRMVFWDCSTIVIASIVVLWKSLIFWNILLLPAFLNVYSVTCTVLLAISVICVISSFRLATIRLVIVISVCRGGVRFGLLTLWFSWINCVSAMSHP